MDLMGCSSIREELVYEKPNVFQVDDGLAPPFRHLTRVVLVSWRQFKLTPSNQVID
jgi:hypothetical protein